MHYLIDFEEFELLPGVESALHLFQELGYRLFVVSNQSGVARGYFTFAAVEELHGKIIRSLAGKGVRVEEIVFCPHHPSGSVALYASECSCRKPKPGMIDYLLMKYDLDAARSYMVGDKQDDALAGVNAGATGVWLRSERVAIGANRVDNPPNIKEFVSLLDFAESLREID